ncbi:leucine-rich repeat domain-containing protein [Segatella copri]|uniref:leucine-rich repeat domain-containing protein n=1 Tax=Segatella copri TaxID=165179 RepID=UPI00294B126D|nr:leucine-rich repeat domain-containing protein [Segatella copri]
MTSIDLPSTITKIDYRAFKDCRNLKNVNIHAGITSIGKGAFQNCDRLEKINIPIGITEIKEKTFYNCSALKTINIPEGVTRIEDYAFDGIQFLLSVTFPSTLQYLSAYAFCDSFNSSHLTAYFYGKKPPVVPHWWSIDYRTVIYVPKGTAEDYYMVLKESFPVDRNQIVEFDATGIDKVTISTDTKEVSRYSVNGQRLSAPTKGLNIVKYSDGSVKKVAVQ